MREARRGWKDCPNENRRSTIYFHVDRLRWRSAESADKMRRSLGSFIKSVRNTQPSRSSNGNGSKLPMLWYVTRLLRGLAVALSAALPVEEVGAKGK